MGSTGTSQPHVAPALPSLGRGRLGWGHWSSPSPAFGGPGRSGFRCPWAPQRLPCHQLSAAADPGSNSQLNGRPGRGPCSNLGNLPVGDRPAPRREKGSASRRPGQRSGTGGGLNPGLHAQAGGGGRGECRPAQRTNFAAGWGRLQSGKDPKEQERGTLGRGPGPQPGCFLPSCPPSHPESSPT